MKIPTCIFAVLFILLAGLPLSACRGAEALSAPVYEIVATYDDMSRTLSAQMRVTVPNQTEQPVDALTFHLPANDYREEGVYGAALGAMYEQKRYGGMEIGQVQGAQSFTLEQNGSALCVTLAQSLAPHESTTIDIAFSVFVPAIAHRLGDAEGVVRLSCFYPVLAEGEVVSSPYGDPLFSRCADYDMTLTFPARYQAIGNGTVTSSTADDTTTAHMQARGVRDIIWLLAEQWNVSSETVALESGSVTVTYAAVGTPRAQSLAIAAQSIQTFSQLFGDYPYETFVLVELPLVMEGMEYCGLAMTDDRLSQRECPQAIAHEAAHMWWYAGVGSDQVRSAWQDEGLAEYSVALFFEQHPEYGDAASFISDCERAYRTYFSVGSQLMGEVNTAMERSIADFAGTYEYRSVIYDKGVILFDRLRGLLGDRKFFAALKGYYRNYCGKIASSSDLIEAFGGHAEELIVSFLSGSCII